VTKKTPPEKPQPLPSMGGSYTRAADGSLIVAEQPTALAASAEHTEASSDPVDGNPVDTNTVKEA
jgi:hypothetical protein